MSPEQQPSNIRTQMQLLLGVENTIKGHFQDTMGQTPEELGHHVLFGENQNKMNKWVNSGTAATGGAVNPNQTQTNQASQTPHTFTSKTGKSFNLDSQNQFQADGWIWQASPDGSRATPVRSINAQ
jgi:hypothetical protein